MADFAGAFGDADAVQVLDIYAASEQPIEGVSGERLAEVIRDESGGPRDVCGVDGRSCNAPRRRRSSRRHGADARRGQRLASRADAAGRVEGQAVTGCLLVPDAVPPLQVSWLEASGHLILVTGDSSAALLRPGGDEDGFQARGKWLRRAGFAAGGLWPFDGLAESWACASRERCSADEPKSSKAMHENPRTLLWTSGPMCRAAAPSA